jgi:transcriptional regulator with XRE-family HTH domain
VPDWRMMGPLSSIDMPIRRIASPRIGADMRAVELGKRIGAAIKRAREDRGWGLEKLAARIDATTKPAKPTHYTTISRLEKGERRLTLDWVEAIAKAMSVDPIELMTESHGSAPLFILGEQVANEIARSLAMVALDGEEPEPGTVQAIALMLQELTATFSAHPQAYTDPAVARPVVALASRRHAPVAN